MDSPIITCINQHPAAHPTDWRCSICGEPFEIDNLPAFNPDLIDQKNWSLWRYREMLPTYPHFTLNGGMTSLVQVEVDGMRFNAKLDYLNPTGSYKDRGTEVLINHLWAHGARDVVEDSSGNAGSSLAMYASGAGMRARVFTPAGAPGTKRQQIGMAAELIEVSGPRINVANACIDAANEPGVVYASHAWSPFFIAGQMTGAWEVWEEMGRRVPGAMVVPVGMGCLLLGWYRGFKALLTAGLIERLPRIFAVQAAASDPIVRAWEGGLDDTPPIETQKTVADGIVIAKPVRSKAVLSAIRDTNGMAFRVEEAEILPMRDKLARRGLLVEPTSATTVTALTQIKKHYHGDDLVVVLTGNGLKTMSVY
jgi:threonine synthase